MFVSSRLELIPTSSWREGVVSWESECCSRLAIFQTRPCNVLHSAKKDPSQELPLHNNKAIARAELAVLRRLGTWVRSYNDNQNK